MWKSKVRLPPMPRPIQDSIKYLIRWQFINSKAIVVNLCIRHLIHLGTNLWSWTLRSMHHWRCWRDWRPFSTFILLDMRHILGCKPRKFIISKDRWESILWCMHLIDNTTSNVERPELGYNKIGKVRWLIDHFVTTSKSFYNPHWYMNVDEIMVAYNGNFSTNRIYLRNKPMQCRMKVWCATCTYSC